MLNVTDNSRSKDNVQLTIINIALSDVIHQTTQFADLLTSTAAPRDPAVTTVLLLRTRAPCRVERQDDDDVELVFVGRVRLRRLLSVSCAPCRRDEFLRVWRSAVESELQPCHLPVT